MAQRSDVIYISDSEDEEISNEEIVITAPPVQFVLDDSEVIYISDPEDEETIDEILTTAPPVQFVVDDTIIARIVARGIMNLPPIRPPSPDGVTLQIEVDPEDRDQVVCEMCITRVPCVMFGCGHLALCRTCLRMYKRVNEASSEDKKLIKCPKCRDTTPYKIGRWT